MYIEDFIQDKNHPEIPTVSPYLNLYISNPIAFFNRGSVNKVLWYP